MPNLLQCRRGGATVGFASGDRGEDPRARVSVVRGRPGVDDDVGVDEERHDVSRGGKNSGYSSSISSSWILVSSSGVKNRIAGAERILSTAAKRSSRVVSLP